MYPYTRHGYLNRGQHVSELTCPDSAKEKLRDSVDGLGHASLSVLFNSEWVDNRKQIWLSMRGK